MPIKVLIVDDMAAIRKITGLYLQSRGFNPIFADSAEQAIIKTRTEKPDIVVTDLHMPDTDGIAMTKKIRSYKGTASVPILMVTSETNEAVLEEARLAGITGLLAKPYTAEKLEMKINEILKP